MADSFSDYQPNLISPATSGTEITPNDSAALAEVTRALYVGTPGDLRVMLADGMTVTLSAAQAGVIYPLRVAQVFASGTSAGNLVGLR